MKTYIAYLRQSTMKQQISGLGVEAQREIIQRINPYLLNILKRRVGRNLTDLNFLQL